MVCSICLNFFIARQNLLLISFSLFYSYTARLHFVKLEVFY